MKVFSHIGSQFSIEQIQHSPESRLTVPLPVCCSNDELSSDTSRGEVSREGLSIRSPTDIRSEDRPGSNHLSSRTSQISKFLPPRPRSFAKFTFASYMPEYASFPTRACIIIISALPDERTFVKKTINHASQKLGHSNKLEYISKVYVKLQKQEVSNILIVVNTNELQTAS